MKKIIILTLMFIGLLQADKYEVTHIKKGGTLNVRDVPYMDTSVVVGRLSAHTTDISIKECTELEDASEWCYIRSTRGASHIEGWVNSYYLKRMSKKARTSKAHIENFLHNFYMAEEENFLDKLQVFYAFPMQKYLWSNNLSLRDLRIKKVNEYKKWPKRDYRLTYLKILKRTSKYIDVQATVRWYFEGHDDYEKGKDVQKLRLIPTDSTFKVSALKNFKHIVFPKPVLDLNETVLVSAEKNETIAPSAVSFAKQKFYIKSGSFFSEISASYLSNISKNGFSYSIQKVKQGNKVIRRVFIGPFDSITDATKALATVRAKINKFAYIQSNIK